MNQPEELVIRENVPLAPLTTLGVGGPARYFVEVAEEGQLIEALSWGLRSGLPVFVLGGGSNLVIADTGFKGLVVRVGLRGIHRDSPAGGVVTVAAGEEWDRFVEWSVENQLWGIECLSGIPGSAGATPVQNVGAYGQDVGEVIQSVRVVERLTRKVSELSRSDCSFAYRSSIFNATCRDRYIILSVTFTLRRYGHPQITYPDLQRVFAGSPTPPSLFEIRKAVIRIRSEKGMVISPGDLDSRSAGSFFKNPVVSEDVYAGVEKLAKQHGFLPATASLPRFKVSSEASKIPAGWLIERAGFHKGFSLGRVGISSRHALALINRGEATAQEILDLMRLIQRGVYSKFGISLKPEPVFIGF